MDCLILFYHYVVFLNVFGLSRKGVLDGFGGFEGVCVCIPWVVVVALKKQTLQKCYVIVSYCLLCLFDVFGGFDVSCFFWRFLILCSGI